MYRTSCKEAVSSAAENQITKTCVAALCGYETVAIMSRGKLPTLTRLNHQYRVIAPVILSGLAAHFYWAWLSEVLDARTTSRT